jgi:bifunctional non-homologous end joining protein LigD
MQRCHWVKPVLIARVKFTEWTHDGQLRQPVFLGLRTDKALKDVFRE